MSELTDAELDTLIEAIGLNRPKRGPGARATCGTASGYRRHRREGEDPCEACRAANTETQREHYRVGAKGNRKLKPIAHGTMKGYKQHCYRKQQACDACRQAASRDSAERYAAGKRGGAR